MQTEIPKQFLLLAGRPVLMHTLERLHTNMPEAPLVLVLPTQKIPAWKELCTQYDFQIPHVFCAGGKHRFDSVKMGLAYLQSNFPLHEDTLIGIHDGARPLLDPQTLKRAFETARQHHTAVPVVESRDSLRIETPDGNQTLDRKKVFAVQTPQVFKAAYLLKAYQQTYQTSFTDDAAVVENSGYPIHLCTGNTQNLKLTYPIDLALAELILRGSSNNPK